MIKSNKKFKKGATSIYVVVIGTLLFSVITVSFIRIIINETAKTTSDELAQSAYDSALAGVEDAKTALKRYRECKDASAENKAADCNNIEAKIEDGFAKANLSPDDPNYGYCDAISEALSRIDTSGTHTNDPREVLIQENSSANQSDNIVQAYTCITIDNTLDDYRATLNSGTPVQVIPLKTGVPNEVTGVRIFWYTEKDGLFSQLNYSSRNAFYPSTGSEAVPTPPTLTAQIIQTANSFTLEQFSNSSGNTTNRGTVVLVPGGEDPSVITGTRFSAVSGSVTHIGAGDIVTSNNHDYNRSSTSNNQPKKIMCRSRLSDEFACVASIELPGPVGGSDGNGYANNRNDDTFFLVLTLPYAKPNTTFAVQLCTDHESGGIRGNCLSSDSDPSSLSIAQFKDVQIAVDSTGRANDMYSRVEARVEFKDHFPFAEFAIQTSGSGEDDSIKKNFYVTSNCFNNNDPEHISDCPDTGDTSD